MNTLTLDRNSAKTLHQQIYIQIREKILNGELPVGSKLPSYRFMNRRYSVNNSTVEKAYNLLETNGYIQRRHGSCGRPARGRAENRHRAQTPGHRRADRHLHPRRRGRADPRPHAPETQRDILLTAAALCLPP